MKRLAGLALFFATLLALAAPAEAVRVRVRHRGHRTTVVVRPGFPIRRTLPVVVVRPPRVAVRVTPGIFLPPLLYAPVVVTTIPVREAIVWEGTEELDADDDWTEMTLNLDQRGKALLLDVSGAHVQLQFAEVVFENGEAQVVDFDEKSLAPGLYNLLDFKDGRKVDHVRVVARAKKNDAKISVRMLK